MEWVVWAAVGWAAVAALWLVILPREARGKSWHRVLALVPFAAFALAALAPWTLLVEAMRLWLMCGAAVIAVLTIAWAAGSALRNHGVMDIAYPLAPLAAAVTAFVLTGSEPTLARGLLLATVGVWSVRLAVQTWGHNIGSERQPYASWRAKFGPRWAWFSLFQVYALQGVTIWVWSLPFVFVMAAPTGPIWPAAAGLAVWLAGFLLQTAADTQLARFKADPANRGGLLDTGVWAWVRHPNYLGESVMWAGWAVMALAPRRWTLPG